jgi:GT2 family glycosyltransferase
LKGFSILIVTWNGLHHLKTFLPSVCATEYPDFEIILADNASTDGSVEWINEHYPEVIVATFEDNYGYCGGNNRAVETASKEILLFLNNDVKVNPDWLYGINKCFEHDEFIGAVQPKILSYNEPKYFEYAGAAGGFIDKFGYPFCRGRIFETVEKDDHQYDEVSEIFWASGAALAIKRDLFIELGGFDEDFEFHMEEIDLCWRVHRSGFKVFYTPESTVYHLGGGSLAMGSPRKVYYNFRNNLFMLWKNYSTSELILRFPIRLKLDVIAAWKSLLSGNTSDFFAIAKAHIHFFKGISTVHSKRKKSVINRPKELRGKSSFSIIWQYFISGKKRFNELP